MRLFGYPEWYEIPTKEYDAFDLLGNTVAVPVVVALQATFVCDQEFDKAAAGCVTVIDLDELQPTLSRIFTVYVPADNPDANEFVPPVGDHEYVYGAVPPDTDNDAVPFDPE